MAILRVEIDVPLDGLDYKTLAEVTASLSVLEEVAKTGAITFASNTVLGSGRKRGRSDKMATPLHHRKLQPGPQSVLDFLRSNPAFFYTSGEIAGKLDMNPNSARPHLHLLLKRGVVEMESTGKGKEQRWKAKD